MSPLIPGRKCLSCLHEVLAGNLIFLAIKVNSGERGAQEEDRTNHRSVETQCDIFYKKKRSNARVHKRARARVREAAEKRNALEP